MQLAPAGQCMCLCLCLSISPPLCLPACLKVHTLLAIAASRDNYRDFTTLLLEVSRPPRRRRALPLCLNWLRSLLL